MIALATLSACASPSRDNGDAMLADTHLHDDASDMASDAPIDAPLVPVECPQGAELVYTIDRNGRMYRFDPVTKAFTNHGIPGCASGQDVSPSTMAVDRFGWAWIRYTNGQLFKLPLSEVPMPNHTCQEVPFTTPPDLRMSGMGFSTDSAGGSTEALYLSGCNSLYYPSQCAFARLEPTTLRSRASGHRPTPPR